MVNRANDIFNLLLSSFKKYFSVELTWEKYMGQFTEKSDNSEQDKGELLEMSLSEVGSYDYNHAFSILESKQKFGDPSIYTLGSLLCKECSDIEMLRGKPNIGYYAHSGTNAVGYTNIDSEDVRNIESVILDSCPDIKNVDFIMSSPGGLIEASLKFASMLRQHFQYISFLLPGSTYSAAAALTFLGNEIIMQSNAHLGPINPRINGFDTYIGKKLYREYKIYSILFPWSKKTMLQSSIAENNVTAETMASCEKLVYKFAAKRLSEYLINTNGLTFLEKIKTKIKIRKIVNFFTDYKRHNSHMMPFFYDELCSIGLPVKKAKPELDAKLRKIRNICEEITTTKWRNGDEEFFARKIYFSGKNWYIMKHVCETQRV